MRKPLTLISWIAISILWLIIVPACSAASNEKIPDEGGRVEVAETDEESMDLEVVVGNKVYAASLADTDAARQFAQQLPLTIHMEELNGNEKYFYMDSELPVSAIKPGDIHAGDLMLYQDDCLVLFHESFSTPYSYTPLGKVNDPEGLAQAVGTGSVDVTFRIAAEGEQQTSSTAGFDFESKTVQLNSGYTMPINGLGTYSLHGDECVQAVKSAIRSGVRLIDTAHMYGNEEEIGRAIREEIDDGTVTREDLFVITKIYPGDDMANPETAIQGCLDRLDIGYVDMMLLHHPDQNDVKAYKEMEKFVETGQIRSLGLSNWYTKELKEFLPQVSITPALVQNEIHPYYQENDVIPYIQSLGIVIQGWYPLGGRGHTAELLQDEVISQIAEAHGVSSAQVILRWNLQKGVVVIPGSSNPDHIKENTELYHFELSDEEMEQIKALDRNEKHDWY